jgi:hypothetical protein
VYLKKRQKMATEAEIARKVLNIVERELTLEEYARFLAAITPKVGDSVKDYIVSCNSSLKLADEFYEILEIIKK